MVFLMPLFMWLKALLGIGLLGTLLYYLLRDVWMMLSSSIVAIRYYGGDILLITQAGDELPGNIMTSSVVTPLLTIVNVLPAGKKRIRSVVIFPDNLSCERFRELRVLLKWDRQPKV